MLNMDKDSVRFANIEDTIPLNTEAIENSSKTFIIYFFSEADLFQTIVKNMLKIALLIYF